MKLLTIEEVAQALGVSRQTVGRMIGDASLPAACIRSGRRKKIWRIRSEALEKWVASKERETARDITGSQEAPTDSNGKHDLSQTNGEQADAILQNHE